MSQHRRQVHEIIIELLRAKSGDRKTYLFIYASGAECPVDGISDMKEALEAACSDGFNPQLLRAALTNLDDQLRQSRVATKAAAIKRFAEQVP